MLSLAFEHIVNLQLFFFAATAVAATTTRTATATATAISTTTASAKSFCSWNYLHSVIMMALGVHQLPLTLSLFVTRRYRGC